MNGRPLARERLQACQGVGGEVGWGMAIFGSVSTVRAVLANDPRFAAALTYAAEILRLGTAARQRIDGLAAGTSEKVELAGGAFAIDQVYESKLRPDAFFESHRKYIDVQVIVAGAEWMEVADIGRLTVSDAYVAERDLLKYADTVGANVLKLAAGDAAVFFPVDGHMPCLRPEGVAGLVRKTVVKVPVL